ncbi:MAG: hypothetical protein IKW62_00085 [Clostridia bacterium]|nr:hypothetical protein [Clostridia bacterium]
MFTIVFALLILGISVSCWLKPETAFSESERRALASLPHLSLSTVFSGEFTEGFEEYTTDQFPLRDRFRTLKALFSTKLLGKMDNNKLYVQDGHISKIEYPENPEMITYAIDRFDNIFNKYLKNTSVKTYLSIVPDKNYFLAPQKGYLSINYPEFIENFKSNLPYMEYIDLIPLLSVDDYYRTDSHWKQENIQDVAEWLGNQMGTDVSAQYKVNTLGIPFNGVYSGQSALPFAPDTIKYLTSETLDACTVTYFDTGLPKQGEFYNMEKAQGKDPYEMYLSGTSPLITIENPTAKSSKELILFRDSFGSSIAPLLAEGYKKITVVDIRYIQSDFLGNFIEFDNQDVLFLYSTTLLNNSMAMR